MTPEKQAYYREYYRKNAEKCQAKSRAWAKAHPEKVKALRSSEYGKQWMREWRKKNPEKAQTAYKKWASQNKGKLSELHKRYAENLRAEMLEVYGGECVCCHEDMPNFLTIDHIETVSAMKKAGKEFGPTGGNSLVQWLKGKGWPKDNYRLLCFNCNCGRRQGECPHEIERRRAALKVVFE